MEMKKSPLQNHFYSLSSMSNKNKLQKVQEDQAELH